MKSLITSLSLLLSSAALAAPADLFTTVLSDPEIAKVLTKNLEKVEVTETYRCPMCYEFTITQTTPIGSQEVVVTTSQNILGKVEIKLVGVSR